MDDLIEQKTEEVMGENKLTENVSDSSNEHQLTLSMLNH